MKEFIEANYQPMLELIENLVNIDSGSYLKSGTDRVGELLRDEYKMIGFDTEVHEQERFGNNLVIRHPEAKAPEIIMIAHLDTVFPEGTAEKTAVPCGGRFGARTGCHRYESKPRHRFIRHQSFDGQRQ